MKKEPEEEIIDNPRHDCPALGRNTIIPRAINASYPEKILYLCPFCSYKVEVKENTYANR